jgi:acetylornithine deacetylase
VQDTVDRAVAEDPALAGCAVSVRWNGFQAEGFEADRDHPMMRLLADRHRMVCGQEIVDLSCTCTTDARFFVLYGDTPATCYGPEATSIHTADESVSLRSLRDVTCVLALFIASWCGLEARV